jgi:hypothetical protein
VVEVRKSHRPQSLRRRSEAGASRGDSGSKAVGQPDPAAVSDLWDLEDYLTECRKQINRTYDDR